MKKSMWRQIREENKENLSQSDVAKKFNISRQSINAYENGKAPMPKKLQIYYLGLRGTKEDKIIIKYLEEELENGKCVD